MPKQPARSSKSKAHQKSKKKTKVRSIWVTIFLVLMMLHGIVATYFFYTLRTQEAALERHMILSLMVLHSLANILAAVGIWYWKKWGLYVYAASTILGVVIGYISVGAYALFYMALPILILGYLLRLHWDYFE